MKKILIIGGGFAGCSSAEILSKLPNTKITLIEKSKTLGAGVRTYFNGGHPFTFGPRHFLTKDKLGKNSVKFGIYGIPESILVNKDLIILKKVYKIYSRFQMRILIC